MVAPTENTVFNHSTRLPNPHAANSEAFHERYHYPLSAAASSQSSPRPTQYSPYCYDQHAYLNGSNTVCPRAENGRVAIKRKAITAHTSYQNDYGYFSAGSSTTFPDSRNNFQMESEPGICVYQPLCSIDTSYSSDNLFYGGERRNVRSRHGDAPHNPAWQPSSSNPPHQLYASVNNFSPNVVGHGGHPPLPGTHPRWIHSTGAGCSGYVMNQSVAGNVLSSGNTGNHGALHCSFSPTFHTSVSRGTGAGPSRYSHQQNPWTSSSYSNLGLSAAAFKDASPLGVGSVASARNPRPLTRSGGLRIASEAQPLFNEEYARVRWSSQGSNIMDVPPYFNPLDFSDEHRDLRLDIDAMSYEELLALEERIGHVNTGLSEDHLPSCLTLTAYCSSTPAREDLGEASCPICLEEYEDGDNLGIMKCLHVYHVSCIKNWLRIKNACPICKTPALDDMQKKN